MKKIRPALSVLFGLVAAAAAYLFIPPPHQASAQFVDQLTFGGTSGGSANAQTFTIPNLAANTTGVQLRFIPGFTNTGPTQINVSGIGLVNVLRPSSIGNVAFSGGEFQSGELTCVTFNGTAYQLACNVDITPIGKVEELRGSAAPRGRLIEDGSCVLQTTYAALFSVIGTTYGSCSAGLFALPDSRGSGFAALDSQGVNGAANRITSAGSGCAATAVGTRCGTQNYTQARSDMVNTSVSVSSTSAASNFGSGSLLGGFQTASGTSEAFASGATTGAVASNGSFNLNGGVTQTAMPHINPVLLGLSVIKY